MSEARVERGGAMADGEPKLTVRIVHRCQFRCPACSTFSGPEGCGVLSRTDFERAMDLLAQADFRGIVNVSGGEPTLHPELAAMLAYASAALPRSRIALFTHGHWVGSRGWRERLESLLAGPNVLLRFSLDRQHAEGIALSRDPEASEEAIRALESGRLAKAAAFEAACRESGAKPGHNFDFAFKGTEDEARAYMASLGEVPLYLIRFRPEPRSRPKTPGFFALDVDSEGQALVFESLGHVASGEPLGGLEALPAALASNRAALAAQHGADRAQAGGR